MARTVVVMLFGAVIGAGTATAQEPKLADVVARVGQYVAGYGSQLASVVAEEAYAQTLEAPPQRAVPRRPAGNVDRGSSRSADPTGSTRSDIASSRLLRSDYALTRVNERGGWIGYRDTFEVDGRPVRDREERLQRMLAGGEVSQAARIAAQNARFNLAEDLLTRNINVPTFALELLHPSNRERFSSRRQGSETVNGQSGWVIEFRERGKPTIVRTPEGGSQPSRVVAVVDPMTGTVLKTTLSWEKVTGSIVVTYRLVPRIPALVPLTMSESYTTHSGATIGGHAIYSNYRQFQTAGRVIE